MFLTGILPKTLSCKCSLLGVCVGNGLIVTPKETQILGNLFIESSLPQWG